MKHIAYKTQAGFVSIFTVIFFMLMITVITVGFLRIMGVEQRQSIDNDLTANALAAAESGIEDGKRALLAYYDPATNPALKTDLAGAFATSNNACNSLTGLASVQTQLGITGQAVGGSNLNQEYTCLNVKLVSPDYLGSAEGGKSEIFPLRGVTPYNQIKISWHLLSAAVGVDGDGQPDDLVPLVPSVLLPQTGGATSWSSEGYPAYLRAQIIGYPVAGFLIPFAPLHLDNRNKAVVLAPVEGGSAAPINFDTVDPNHNFDTAKGSPNTSVQCGNDFTQYGTYLCTATLSMPSTSLNVNTTNSNYFLRVTPFYSGTHFRVQLADSSSGATIDMSDVQPLIDATGKAEDVYRRVQVRVRLNAITGLPEYVAESANTICKNMQVADGSPGSWQLNNCP